MSLARSILCATLAACSTPSPTTPVDAGPDPTDAPDAPDAPVPAVDASRDPGSGLVASLVSRPEPPGVHCAHGGTAVSSGIDRDRSGTLEPGEIDATSYACGFVPELADEEMYGEVTIHSPADAVRYAPLRKLHGNLTLRGSGTAVLPALTSVDGTVACTSWTGGTAALPVLGLVNWLELSPGCEPPALPGLEAVSEAVVIDRRGAEARTIALPALTLAGRIVLQSTADDVLDVPALPTTATLELSGPASIHAPAMRSVQRLSGVAVSRLELPALTTAELRLTGAMQLVALPQLRSAVIELDHVPSLAALDLPALETGQVTIDDASALVALTLPRFTSGSVSLTAATAAARLDLSSYATAGFLFVENTGLGDVALPVLTRIASELRLTHNPALTRLTAPQLTSVPSFTITQNPQLPTCMATAIADQTGTAGTISGNGTGSCP